MNKCRSCGNEVNENYIFCQSCGNNLNQDLNEPFSNHNNINERALNCNVIEEENYETHLDINEKIEKRVDNASNMEHIISNMVETLSNKTNYIIRNLRYDVYINNWKSNFIRFIKRNLSICISLFFIFVFLTFLISPLGTPIKLKYYGLTKNDKGLINYINANYNDTKASQMVELAIDEICEAQLNHGIDYLEGLFFEDNIKPDYLNKYIIYNFNKYKIKFKSSKALCDFYIDGNSIDAKLKDYLITMMKQFTPEEIEQNFYERIKLLYNNKNFDEGLKLSNNYKSLNIGNSDKIDSITVPTFDLLVYYNQKSGTNTDDINKAIINLMKKNSKEDIDNGFFTELGNLFN